MMMMKIARNKSLMNVLFMILNLQNHTIMG